MASFRTYVLRKKAQMEWTDADFEDVDFDAIEKAHAASSMPEPDEVEAYAASSIPDVSTSSSKKRLAPYDPDLQKSLQRFYGFENFRTGQREVLIH